MTHSASRAGPLDSLPTTRSVSDPASPTAADWLLGAGGAYLLSLPLVTLGASWAGQTQWPFLVFWIIGIGINAPHYGATLVRVYGRAEERRKYAFFATGITALLAAAYVTGLRVPGVAAALVTLYFTWSPWHFAGQNYGVALLFLRRSGVAIDATTKRWLYVSFVLSFALAFVALHIAGAQATYAPSGSNADAPDALLRLGIPRPLGLALALGFGLVYLGSLIGVAWRLRRIATLRTLLPVGCIVLCQALWFGLPALMDVSGAWGGRPLALAALWISGAHSLQYMWVTYDYARRNGETPGLTAYGVQIFFVGCAALVLPGILGSRDLLGVVSWKEGVAILAFSVLNLHHFILDGAVWKLRDGRIARLLLRQGASDSLPAPTRSAGMRAALWTIGALCIAVHAADLVWYQAHRLGAPRLAAHALDALESIGRTHDDGRIVVGRELLGRGDTELARAQFERSLAVRETADAYGGLGRSHQMQGQLDSALAAYRAGLTLEPDNAALLRRAALTLLQQDAPQEAIPLFERSLELEPDHEKTRQLLSRARARSRAQTGPASATPTG